ncbi:MAG: MFS transporter [Alphaproteobacteria bacterium]|nr:MFS transporter [Alphaproteobacteria bacterium]
MSPKSRAIVVIASCQVMALALWFSASATLPQIIVEFGLSATQSALITSAVQAGFVVGTLGSGVLGLADRFDSRRLLSASALCGAIANTALLWVPLDTALAVVLRGVTGACLAGVYPVGMRMIGTWADRDLGLLIGILVGALSLGSATPHLVSAFGGVDWRITMAVTSASAVAAAVLIHLAAPGPRQRLAQRFEPRMMFEILRNPPMRLALGGYLGHQWELYAMWAWLGVFLDATFRAADGSASLARVLTFAAIGLGGLIGCIAGGLLADRIGRTRLTILAMSASGSCAVAAGLVDGMGLWPITIVCLFWGLTICADSAQFSASITELSDPSHVGTMLTMQTCIGFLLTLATIHLVPVIVAAWGWPAVFYVLALGPACGVASMAALRARPEAARLAGGRR